MNDQISALLKADDPFVSDEMDIDRHALDRQIAADEKEVLRGQAPSARAGAVTYGVTSGVGKGRR